MWHTLEVISVKKSYILNTGLIQINICIFIEQVTGHPALCWRWRSNTKYWHGCHSRMKI